MLKTLNTYCSFCGHAFETDQAWPRLCTTCKHTSYRNPIPVSVLLLPIEGGGVLTIRRGIEPQKGELALPGGFVDFGESWQQAAVRELEEEARIKISAQDVRAFDIKSTPDGKLVLIFGVAKPLAQNALKDFIPTNETSERVIVYESVELAFPLHTEILARFFSSESASPSEE